MLKEIRLRYFPAIFIAVFSLACLVGFPRGASALDAAGFIAKLGDQAIQALGPSVPSAQRIAEFRRLFDRDFDLRGAAQFVLGPSGRSLTPEQHQEFLALFRDYLAEAYGARLAEYGGAPFSVTGSRPDGDETVVSSEVQRRNGRPVEMDWHVIDRDGRFLVADVYVDGVSMKVTHRQEFAAIIQRNGGRPEALFAVLRQQLAQGPMPSSGSSSEPAPAPQR
jgi:phospholipid transport system substrate-binding protein